MIHPDVLKFIGAIFEINRSNMPEERKKELIRRLAEAKAKEKTGCD